MSKTKDRTERTEDLSVVTLQLEPKETPREAIRETVVKELSPEEVTAKTWEFLQMLRDSRYARILTYGHGNSPQQAQSITCLAVGDQEIVDIKFVIPR